MYVVIRCGSLQVNLYHNEGTSNGFQWLHEHFLLTTSVLLHTKALLIILFLVTYTPPDIRAPAKLYIFEKSLQCAQQP